MNAIEILENDHTSMVKAMQEITLSSGLEKKGRVLALKGELEMHNHVEEDILCPALLAHSGADGIGAKVGDAHDAVLEALAQLFQIPAEDPTWMPAFSAMQDRLLKHMADEEAVLFIKIRSLLSAPELRELGVRIEIEKNRQQEAA